MVEAERKKQIISHTIAIIGDLGLQGLTTAVIAKRCGITEAAIYRHFENKEAILTSVVNFIGERLLFVLNKIISEDISPLQKLNTIFQTHLDHIETNKGIPKIIYTTEVHVNEKLRQILFKIVETYIDKISAILKDGINENQIKQTISISVEAKKFLSMIQFTAFRYSLSGFEKKPSIEGKPLWDSYLESIQK